MGGAARGIELNRTGIPVVDEVIPLVIAACEGSFRGRVQSYYLIGSHAGAGAVATSDLDIDLVFRDAVTPTDEARLDRLMETCSRQSPFPVDLTAVSARDLFSDPESAMIPRVTLTTEGFLLHGDDLLDRIARPSPEQFRRWAARAPIINYGKILRGTPRLTFPLDFPDPSGAFFGYDLPLGRGDGRPITPGTKYLVASVCWTATARLALAKGLIVGRRRDSVARYRAEIGDRWAALVEAIYQECRDAWACRLPDEPADRARLRELCRQTLDFENDYLRHYRDYLLAELSQGDDQVRRIALERLAEVRFSDPEVAAALRAATMPRQPG